MCMHTHAQKQKCIHTLTHLVHADRSLRTIVTADAPEDDDEDMTSDVQPTVDLDDADFDMNIGTLLFLFSWGGSGG